MFPGEVLDIGREALVVLLKVGAPLMLTALVVGLVISFVQALTQIQEMTLVFVPKIACLFFMMIWLLPYMGRILKTFTESLFDKMINL